MNVKIFDKNSVGDSCDCFELEDEIDCAILGDQEFDIAMKSLKVPDEDTSLTNTRVSEEDLIDTTIDYDDTVPEVDMVGVDADEMIDAERDLALNPLSDDELIDVAIGTSND